MTYDGEPKEFVTGMPEHIIGGVIRALENVGAAIEVRNSVESPIEGMFAGALIGELRRKYGQDGFDVCLTGEARSDMAPSGMLLVPQYRLDRFRYDFAIKRVVALKPILLIECDGRGYHQEHHQIANDIQKDGVAQRERIPLLRLSGSHIHYRIEACVKSVIRALDGDFSYIRKQEALRCWDGRFHTLGRGCWHSPVAATPEQVVSLAKNFAACWLWNLGDSEQYGRSLAGALAEQGDSAFLIDSLLRRLRRTEEWRPSIAKVLAARLESDV